jgi:hypothetical protein
MSETDVVRVPSGMLLISKEGERDRAIYPVHAVGWRRLGWTVQEPAPELEEDEEPPLRSTDGRELFPAGTEPQAASQGADPDGGIDPEGVSDPGEPAVLDLSGLTKAEIIEAMRGHFRVELDASQTKAELLAQAEALILAASQVQEAEASDTLDTIPVLL